MENKEIIEKKRLANKMESFCLEIHCGGKRIVYSGDVGALEDLEVATHKANLFITECMHVNLQDLFKLIKKNRVASTILTHVPPEMEGEKDRISKEAGSLGLPDLKFASDGMVVEL